MCFLNFSKFFCKKTETNFDNRENSCDRKKDKCHDDSRLYHFKGNDCNIDRFECGNKRPNWGCGDNDDKKPSHNCDSRPNWGCGDNNDKKPSHNCDSRPNWGCGDNNDREPSHNGDSRPNWGCGDNDDKKPSCNGDSRPNWGCGDNDDKQEQPPVLDNPDLPEQPSAPNEPEIPSIPDKPNEDVSNPPENPDEIIDDDYCAELPDIEKTDGNI